MKSSAGKSVGVDAAEDLLECSALCLACTMNSTINEQASRYLTTEYSIGEEIL